MGAAPSNVRPAFDRVITDIAAYVDRYQVKSKLAFETAHYSLLDSLGCGFEALAYPDCARLLGPIVPGTATPHGARVPATRFQLDPVQAAFNIGILIRWLDYNDTFCGETVVHPSDTWGAILAAADWRSRQRVARDGQPLVMRDVLEAAIKAYEIMGGLALENGFTTRLGLDHVILVKVACAAVATKLLGGTHGEIVNALSNAWIDGHALATYRRGPGTGSRKSWAAADAASRGVWLALLALKGEMGYPSALTAKTWGFYDVHCKGKPFGFQRPYGAYVMENVQFKLAYAAAFHAQTAAEAAIKLHPQVKDRIRDIAKVELWTHHYAMGYLNRTGPLSHFAERDHCLQYIAAIGLIFGGLTAGDYEDRVAADPRIDAMRVKMVVREDKRYTRGFLDPLKRSNANALLVHFKDGTRTSRVEVEYPVGHRRRRREGVPRLVGKFEQNLARVYAEKQRRIVLGRCLDRARLCAMPVDEFFDLLCSNNIGICG